MRKILVAIAGVGVAVGCRSGEEKVSPEKKEEPQTTITPSSPSSRSVLYNFPSPFEVARVLSSAGAKYNKEILVGQIETGKYLTRKDKAILTGILSADMSYALLFGDIQTSLSYFSKIHKLLQEMNMGDLIDKSTAKAIEEHGSNADTLQALMNKAIASLNRILSETGQEDMGVYIFGGGLTEGLYLASALIDKNNPQEELLELIVSQKDLVNAVIDIATHSKTKVDSKFIENMQQIASSLNGIEIEEKTTASTEGDRLILGGTSSPRVAPQAIERFVSTITRIRQQFVNPGK